MINNIPHHLTVSSNTTLHHPHSSSNNNPASPSQITQVHNQHIELASLPTEIKQRIAFQLYLESYSSLRLASKDMSEALPSLSTMLTSLKNGCSGELKKNYEFISGKAIREMLANETKDDVIQSLKYSSVGNKAGLNTPITCLETRYYPKPTVTDYEWNGKILLRCPSAIVTNSQNTFIPSTRVTSFNAALHTGQCWEVELYFNNNKINTHTLGFIFESFNKVFHEERSSDRLLLAISASKLKNFWYNNPPNNLSQNDIIKCSNQYPELFSAGKTIAGCITKKSQESNA